MRCQGSTETLVGGDGGQGQGRRLDRTRWKTGAFHLPAQPPCFITSPQVHIFRSSLSRSPRLASAAFFNGRTGVSPLHPTPHPRLLGTQSSEWSCFARSTVFGFGCLLYEVLCRRLLSAGLPEGDPQAAMEYLGRVAWSGWRPQLPDSLPKELRLLISLCWHRVG